jgi:trehalose-6-phosphate synthase/Kef-type K+ transport system membrane component KefB
MAMKRLLAIVLIVVAMVAIRQLGPSASAGPRSTALALGFALVAALVTGEFLRRFRLPRLTGYLLFGLLVGPYLGNVITESMAQQLLTVNGVATTLIAFIAGLTLNIERLERRVAGAGWTALVTLGVAMAGLAVLAWLLWPWLPVAPNAQGLAKVSMIAVLVVIVVSFSPTMTAAVIAETGARGKLSDFVLTMVVLADLVVLVMFSLVMQLARATFADSAPDDVNMLVRLAWEIGGAVAFGCLVGASFALYMRYVGREMTLVLLLVCLLLSQVGMSQRVEPLLAAMAAGIVIANVAVAQSDALKAAIHSGALPLLVVFFVAIGASLRLDTLMAAGVAAIGLAGARVGLIWIGVRAGLHVSGTQHPVGSYVWTGLISQAGITLGLAAAVATEFPTWGVQVQMLLVALIAIDELVGPALFRTGLVRAGEIDANASRPLLVVSNREPYLHHVDDNGRLTCSTATGGVAVALDALMRDRGGTWIAHGAGTADRDTVDAGDKVRVPPENPSYTLRRLWIDPAEFAGYYGGFANEGLWPLCHLVDVRPKFRSEDWAAYKKVNAQFAAAIEQEMPTPDTPVFLQDYHMAMTASYLRKRRLGVRTALFWHIPWPNPDRLLMCQWRRELLAGLLANDLLAFQVERDRRNFILAVEDELDAEIEADGASVRFKGRNTTVVAAPIGVDYDRIQGVVGDARFDMDQEQLRQKFGLGTDTIIGVGVDRLDYTKGIPERLEAIDRVLTQRPELRGRLTFVQIGVPSRSELKSYGAIESEIDRTVQEVNARHAVPNAAPPIHYHKSALGLAELVGLYRMAHFCVVSSLADGMNLVAKEFVAARDDEGGVLVLSEMAGAAEELREALIINPYDVDGFVAAITRAIDMRKDERMLRMRAMRRIVAGRNVFSWASDILEGLESLWTKPLQYAARAPEDAPV